LQLADFTDALVPILAATIGIIGSVVSGMLLWLIRDKIRSIETQIEDNRKERVAEHEVTLNWLMAITEAVNMDKETVEVPDELSYTIERDNSD